MLLAIFGAGASFDSVPHLPPGSIFPALRPPLQRDHPENDRPPLANQLFDTRPRFVEAMRSFPEILEVVPILRKPDVLVERELAILRDQGREFPRANKELAAVLFYLHFALWECQRHWNNHHLGINNYVTFVREIERWRLRSNEHVLFVTFNYDTMLEQAMEQVLGASFTEFNRYVSQVGYTLVKLHGSINWGHEVETVTSKTPSELIARASTLSISEEYSFVARHPMVMSNGSTGYPALSIPVEQKDEFSCPARHLEALCSALSQVTKVITIGWRAMEFEFLKMLRDHLAIEQEVLIISGDERGANETLANLKKGACIFRETIVPHYGFTGLIHNLSFLDGFLNYARPKRASVEPVKMET